MSRHPIADIRVMMIEPVSGLRIRLIPSPGTSAEPRQRDPQRPAFHPPGADPGVGDRRA
jgi:hypothetical protein